MLNVSVLTDPGFCPHSLNKYASIMACGNGYMGIRARTKKITPSKPEACILRASIIVLVATRPLS